MPEEGIFSSEGTEAIGQTAGANNAIRSSAAKSAISNKGEFEAAKIYREAQEKAADKMDAAKKQAGVSEWIGKGIGFALPLIACDMRLKHDYAPLEYTEVTDDLADLAFTVKALRECS